MVVLKAIGAFFAKIGRWIKDTAWVQPLLIVGAIFGIIFAIPKIVEAANTANTDANAAQSFFEKNEISAQGKEGKLSEDSTLDKFFTILEDTESTTEEVYNNLNNLLRLNNKQFFLVLVNTTTDMDPVYTGMNYLKKNWSNDEFKSDLGDSKFTYRTIYTDRLDKYDNGTNLLDDVYAKHVNLFEQMASDLAYTQFAENMDYTEGYYDKLIPDDGSCGLTKGLIFYFDFAKDAVEGVETRGLRTCMTNGDVGGSTDYERAQKFFYCWVEKEKTLWGTDYTK